MTSIAIAMMTFYGEWCHLINCFNSLEALCPDEVNIVDTSNAEPAVRQEFFAWMKAQAGARNLPIRIVHRPWTTMNYRDHKNAAMAMCHSDWTVLIDSDEMLSLELASQLRDFVADLPDSALAIRTRRLTLLDDERMLTLGLWPPWRPGRGSHPRVVKTGTGEFRGPRLHEVYDYPGRKTIKWESPEHPKVDWRDHYMLHLWVYQDNPLRRKWGKTLPLVQLPSLDAGNEAVWREAQRLVVRNHRWDIMPIPKEGTTWCDVVWNIMPNEWIVKWNPEKGRWVYDSPYRQGQR